MTIQDGVYSIATALDANQRCDIEGASLALQARWILYGSNDHNNQKVLIQTTDDGYKMLQPLHSGHVLDVPGTTNNKGSVVIQYPYHNTNNQKWTITKQGYIPTGSTEEISEVLINGEAFDLCEIKSKAIDSTSASQLCLDAYEARKANLTPVCVWTPNNQVNQRWIVFKDSYRDSALPVPASVGLSYDTESTGQANVAIAGEALLYPVWIGGEGSYQLRYRMRQRLTNTDSWTEWGYWVSPEGLSEELGWYDIWAETGSDSGTSSLRHHIAGISFNVDQAVYDKTEAQIEVRRFQTNGHAVYGHTHGASSTGTVQICYRPTFSIEAVSFAPDGLRLAYTSSFLRNGNKVSLTITANNKKLVEWQQAELGYDDTLVIPIKNLAFIPEDNTPITIEYRWTTIDTAITDVIDTTIQYTTGHQATVNAAFTPSDGYTEFCELSSEGKVWLLIEQGDGSKLIACENKGGTHHIIPPLGRPYKVFCVVDGADDIEDTWATAVFKRPSINSKSLCLWNYGDMWTSMHYDMTVDRQLERDYSTQLTSGRSREVISFGRSVKASITVSGTVSSESVTLNTTSSDFEQLSVCGYAIFRTPVGSWHDVAILDISESYTGNETKEIQVSMKEVS